jgi:hypothetical protein
VGVLGRQLQIEHHGGGEPQGCGRPFYHRRFILSQDANVIPCLVAGLLQKSKRSNYVTPEKKLFLPRGSPFYSPFRRLMTSIYLLASR